MPRIRAVLLDAGDTLITERTSRGEVYAAVLHRAGIERDPATMLVAMQHTHALLPENIEGQYRYSIGWFEHFIRGVLERVGVEWSEALVAGFFRAFRHPHTFRVFEDVAPCLDELRLRDLKLAIVSNWAPHLPEMLAGHGLAASFEDIVVSSSERVEKPDPAIYGLALRRLGVAAEDAAFVGDSWANDVLGPRSLGIAGCLLDRSGRHRDLEPRISSLEQLPGWLDSLSR